MIIMKRKSSSYVAFLYAYTLATQLICTEENILRNPLWNPIVLPNAGPASDFPTEALADLVHLHDRLVIKATFFFKNLQTTKRLQEKWRPQSSEKLIKPVCIVAIAANAKLLYIQRLVFMLTEASSLTPSQLINLAEIHVWNTDDHIQNKIQSMKKIAMLKFHELDQNSTKYGDSHHHHYRAALDICKKSLSKWCIIFQDAVIPPVDFIKYFLLNVVKPFLNKEDDVGLIKLFDPFNNGPQHSNDLQDPEWVKSNYNRVRSKSGEDYTLKKWSNKHTNFKIVPTSSTYMSAAIAFPYASVTELLELYESNGGAAKIKEMLDNFICDTYPQKLKKKKFQCQPSMVNYISLYGGDYTEVRHKDNLKRNPRAFFSGIYTDVRVPLHINSLP